MKILLLASALLTSNSLFAAQFLSPEHEISSFTVTEITHRSNVNPNNKSINDIFPQNTGVPGTGPSPMPGSVPMPGPVPMPTPGPGPILDQQEAPQRFDWERAGKVVSVARDMVALGEAVYTLVKKGKPTNTTDYTAISVVPKDPATKEIVGPFELEGFSTPVQKTYVAIVKNGFGIEVVRFEYQLIYSYGGSYEGKGKYLTGIVIVPKNVETSFGWDFNATMKLNGMMNHGTKKSPIAGALIGIKYQMNSWIAAFERNDSLHITGAGVVTPYGLK